MKDTHLLMNDHMTSYLRFWRSLGSPYSKKALEITRGKSEIVIPINRWFRKDWSINEVVERKIRKKKLHRNLGTFHGFLEFHPTNRRYVVDYDDEKQRERNIRILKAQIRLVSKLSQWKGTNILVIHPGGSYKQNLGDFIRSFTETFAPCMKLADDLKVQISIEPDMGAGKIKYYGSADKYENVVELVKTMTQLLHLEIEIIHQS